VGGEEIARLLLRDRALPSLDLFFCHCPDYVVYRYHKKRKTRKTVSKVGEGGYYSSTPHTPTTPPPHTIVNIHVNNLNNQMSASKRKY